MVELGDADLVRLSLQGDGDAFSILVQRHQGVVMTLCLRRGASLADAEDSAQEAFLRAFRGLRRLKDASRFGAWVCGIAQHVLQDRARAESRRREAPAGDGFSETEDARPSRPDLDPDQREELARVTKALGELDEPHRLVIAMRYLEGLSAKEIAEKLGEPRGTVRSRLHYAFEHLRSKLAVQRMQR